MGHGQWAIGQGTGSLGRGRQLLQADGTEVKGDDALLTSYLWTADGPPKTLPSTGLAHAIRDQESQPLLSRLSDTMQPHSHKHGAGLVQASAIAMARAQPSEGLYD
ncbi:hypothetical protein COCVIDRAFT_20864 [Bipolaris victoriae FI3]|uniref:Uncharacterized protein n=2 Tax=Bipolaris TaxID=33194 RepID=W6YQX8_COCC2|nr:uncharacterized protein COCCADRAFT_25856 [Bipolaris zeicola 26-R-13]XP_014550758.1 hypothetical protein COCVIDRAFT_20864 [Bipolaris victoriae FI3]EUC33881.1 hypothetical protein COCCADRAFT_25856 [Bipolaris zeicola 26-R-13]